MSKKTLKTHFHLFVILFLIILLTPACSKKKKPVAPDTIPPVVKTVVSLDTTKLFISFSEELKPTFMLDTLNYLIMSYETLDVHVVDIDPMRKNCVLVTEPQESTYYNMEIKNMEDKSGNKMADTSLTFIGIGVQVDTILPVVHFIEPSQHDTLYGFQYLSVNATDNTGITRVYFYLNDSLLEKDKYFPYYCIVDVRTLTPGNTYTIYASAVDYSANFGYSETLDVFIGYPPPFPYVVIDKIPTGSTPFNADITTDGTQIYFPQVDNGIPSRKDIVMLNTITNTIDRTIPIFTGVSYFVDVFGNEKVFFTSGKSFSVYDILSNSITKTVEVAEHTQGIVHLNNETLYIARDMKEDVLTYYLPSDSMIDSISVSGNPTALAIDTVHNEVYAAVYSQNLVSVIDIASNTIKANIPVSGYPFDIIFSPTFDRAYISESSSNSFAVVETSNHTLLDDISPAGLVAPKGMAITNDGEHLFITSSSNSILVINTFDYSVEWDVQVGLNPYSVVFTPSNDKVYAICQGSQTQGPAIYCIGY